MERGQQMNKLRQSAILLHVRTLYFSTGAWSGNLLFSLFVFFWKRE